MSKHAFIETELGLLPSDWIVDTLGEMFRPFTSASFSREEMDAQSGVACVHYGDIHKRFGNIVDLDIEKLPLISEEKARAYKLLKDGDLLLADASEDDEGIGKSIVVIVGSHKVIAGLHTIPLRPRKDLDTRFPSYLFTGKLVKRQIEKLSEGTKVNSISFAKIKDVFIPFPPAKEEQSRIASALFDIDTLIRDLDRTIEKKQNIRQGAMEQLLSGKKRLPGFKGEWIEMKVSEIGKLSGAGVDKKSNPDEVPVRLVNFLDVYHRSRIANSELHHWVTATPEKVQSCNVKRGDIFFTPSSEMPDDIGQSAVAVEDMENVCYSYHIYRLRPFIELDPDYGAYAFQNKYFFDQVKVESEGSGKRYVVSLNKFKELYALLPPTVEEQQAIASTLTAMDDEIAMLQLERTKYANIRSGMMDDLLSGTKRL